MEFGTTLHNQPGRRYWLRWRFEYGDGKPAKYGMWSNPGPANDLTTKAWNHNRGVVKMAIVEGKDLETKQTVALAACSGEDFVNFEWMAVAFVNPFNVKTGTTPRTKLAGLKLKTRYHEHRVDEGGNVETVARTPEDMNYNYATFGR